VACEVTEPEAPAEPSREQAEARAEAQAEANPPERDVPPPPPPGSPAIGVELLFSGVAPLHQSFFSEPEAVGRLGRSLHGHHSDPMPLEISFDSENHLGIIRLRLDPGAALVPIHRAGDTLQLADLAPLTMPIASYRSDLASRLDFRIESFHIELVSVRGLSSCTFRLSGQPPDGRNISPCVSVGGQEHCGITTAAGVSFQPKVADQLATCLDL
jgi:hypothetical protein